MNDDGLPIKFGQRELDRAVMDAIMAVPKVGQLHDDVTKLAAMVEKGFDEMKQWISKDLEAVRADVKELQREQEAQGKAVVRLQVYMVIITFVSGAAFTAAVSSIVPMVINAAMHAKP